jgi:hypothetical protein
VDLKGEASTSLVLGFATGPPRIKTHTALRQTKQVECRVKLVTDSIPAPTRFRVKQEEETIVSPTVAIASIAKAPTSWKIARRLRVLRLEISCRFVSDVGYVSIA